MTATGRLLAAGAATATAASPGVISEFSVGLNAGSSPADIVAGPDGNLWFTDIGNTKAIGRITPSGSITEFATGLNAGSSPGSPVTGPDGNLWFTDGGSTKAIGRITPSGSITEFTTGLKPGSSPELLVSGTDGNLWFTDDGATGAIGRITSNGTITEFSVGSGSKPFDIAAGPDGNMWFTNDGATHAIGRITPSGVITQFTTGLNSGSALGDIVSAPEGDLWFTDDGATKAIGRITPSGVITEFSTGLNPGSSPSVLASGPDHNLWFVDRGSAKAIGRITTSSGTVAPPSSGAGTGSGGVLGTSSGQLTCSVSLHSRRLTEKNNVVTLKLIPTGSAATCSGRLTFTVKTTIKKRKKKISRMVQIATRTFSVRAGKTATLTLKLNARGRALLKAHRGHLNVRLTILRSAPAPSTAKTTNVSIAPQKTPKTKVKAKKPGK
jgi:streptogramin lyase